MRDEYGLEYDECLVGNIIGNHYWGTDKAIKTGSKHFRAGAKVYCVFMYSGMGHEQVRVLGKPRKASRMIDVVMGTKFIKNFRLQKIYAPRVIAFLKKHPQSANADEFAKHSLDFLNKCNIEIKDNEDNNAGDSTK